MTTPRAVYAHIMKDRNADFMNSLNARFSRMQHEMQHEIQHRVQVDSINFIVYNNVVVNDLFQNKEP